MSTNIVKESRPSGLAEAAYELIATANESTFDATKFFEKFELLAQTPNASHILRELILSYAVQGKIAPQSANDEPISNVLNRMKPLPRPARYKNRSVAKIQGVGALSIGQTTKTLPVGWANPSLVDVAKIESGHTPSRSRPDWWGGDIPWVGVVDARIHDGKTIYKTAQHTNEEGLSNSAARLLPAGTVCVSRTASVGYVITLGVSMATSQDFVNWVPTEAVTSDWLQLVLTAEKPGFRRFSKGAVHQTIYFPEWMAMHLMLPPLAEQKRIVAKVDELMGLCDRLEALEAERKDRHASLSRAALARFADSPTPTNLQFLFHNTFEVHPNELRSVVLSLAVHGQLVDQAETDIAATELLREIGLHKSDLLKQKLIRKGSVKKSIADPFTGRALPCGWVQAELDSVCYKITDGTHKTPIYVDEGVRFVSAKDITGGNLVFDRCRFITESEHALLYNRCNPERNDIVISKSGSIGTVALIEDDGEFSLFESLALLKFSQQHLYPRFLVYALRFACENLIHGQIRGVGVKHLHLDVIRGLEIWIPPLAEQKRIVAKVDELMALVDELEQQLANSRTLGQQLLEAVVAELTN
jgi:restriction endonuclease S subunit